jgi:hypothetical protein
MADYSPPTLSDLWALIGRDLTDPDHKVFNTSQLTDYINGGIAELNRVRPLETVVTTGYDGDSDTVPLGPLPIDDPFVVEMMDNDGRHAKYILHAKSAATVMDGWDYFAHTLVLGPAYSEHVLRMCRDNGWTLRIWGYRGRDPLILDDDGAEFNALEEEYAVRLYARMEAYRSLNVDRGLFQQWQQQANNSDVSPTQLNGMLVTAEGSFDRQQKRLFLPRRLPMV